MKRSFVLPTILGLVAVMAVGFWGYRERQMRVNMETYVNNGYQRAFYNMADHVQNVEVLLGKSLLVPAKKYDGAIYNNIWQHAAAARENLSQLPVNQELAGRTSKFLTQVGDYTHTLATQSAGGGEIDGKKWDTLSKLYSQAGTLNKELQAAQADIQDGRVTVRELVGETKQVIRGQAKNTSGHNFQNINNQMQEFPTLIYDGPFSDHLEKPKARGLTGQVITSAEARGKALSYIKPLQKNNVNLLAQVTDKTNGKIPGYRVELNPQKDKRYKTAMGISQKGGYLVWMLNNRPVGDKKIDIDTARATAQKFLEGRGYKNMKETYYQQVDGAVTFNFAYRDKSVIIYPDLIKVTVALDRGDVIAMDAAGYLMSHHVRHIGIPKITRAEAEKNINKNVQIRGARLAVIPLESGGEKLTYEFDGLINKERFLIYIDTDTGKQINILKVINTPNGTLTM